jgi:TnpA family transposase
VARVLDEDELIGNWTLVGDELEQLSGRRGATKLGFALLLRFYAVHGRFPAGRGEIPDQAVAHVARLVDVPPDELGLYEWDGRTIKAHRADVRRYFGFRECTVADADKAAEWLAANVCEKERQAGQVREELLAHLKGEQIEPPARDRVRRIIGTALRQAEQSLTARIASRIPADAVARMLALIARAADPGDEETAPGEAGTLFGAAEVTGVDVFAAIRDEPGNVSVKTIGQEAFKLGAIRAVGLPDDLFADVAPKVLAGWRARVAAEAPSHLRSHPHEIMVTLLAAYLYCRQREITDALADLLIATVHRINARADTKVTSDFVAELKRVSGKENILFKMTEAALQSPGERVEDVIYPAVPGGHETLVALLREFKANGTSWRQHRQRVFKASYTGHYRTGLIQIIEVLEFGSANTVHAPMVEALTLIKRYKADVPGRVKCYAAGEHVPVDGIIPAELAELMYQGDGKRRRILRTVYECGAFQALREKLRCKEIWVAGAEKWRNPDLDLPADFEDRRAENYAQLRKPLDPRRFTGEMREELDAELSALNDALGGKGLAWLKITERRNAGAICLTPLDAAPEPRNLRRLKTAIHPLGRGPADGHAHRDLPAHRLPECLHPGRHPEPPGPAGAVRAAPAAGLRLRHRDRDPRGRRRRPSAHRGRPAVRAAPLPHRRCLPAVRPDHRQRHLRRPAGRAVGRGDDRGRVADSTQFSAFDQNIFTEWHSRYRRAKRGVLIYWTVDTVGSMAVHSQLFRLRGPRDDRGRDAARDGHGGRAELRRLPRRQLRRVRHHQVLDFDLIARFKQISTMKLYVPGRGDQYAYPALAPALTRPVRWEIIENNYDLMMKYATAIRLRTASTEALLRRFTSETTHPAYAAMLEVGRAQRSIFLARRLRDRDLQRETESGLNVMENYNGVNDYIRFGKRGELASNRREEQELGMLCLHILQSSLGLVNTLMIQDTLALPEWADVLTDADRRGLTRSSIPT